MRTAVKAAKTLADIFLFIVPLTFFVKVAFYTKKYCYDDWVEQKIGKDRDGHDKKKPYFVDCTADTPGARHREDTTINKKYDICAG